MRATLVQLSRYTSMVADFMKERFIKRNRMSEIHRENSRLVREQMLKKNPPKEVRKSLPSVQHYKIITEPNELELTDEELIKESEKFRPMRLFRNHKSTYTKILTLLRIQDIVPGALLRNLIVKTKTMPELVKTLKAYKWYRDHAVEVGMYSTDLLKTVLKLEQREFAQMLFECGIDAGFWQDAEQCALLAKYDARRGEKQAARKWFITMLAKKLVWTPKAISMFVKVFTETDDDALVLLIAEKTKAENPKLQSLITETAAKYFIQSKLDQGRKEVAAEFLEHLRNDKSFEINDDLASIQKQLNV